MWGEFSLRRVVLGRVVFGASCPDPVSALGRFGPGRFGLGRFGLGRWVDSALGRFGPGRFGRSLYQNVDCLGQADKQIDRVTVRSTDINRYANYKLGSLWCE